MHEIPWKVKSDCRPRDEISARAVRNAFLVTDAEIAGDRQNQRIRKSPGASSNIGHRSVARACNTIIDPAMKKV